MFNEIKDSLGMLIFYTIVCLVSAILIFMLSSCFAYANEEKFTFSQIADAIFLAEGGNKAAYLYGIRSVRYDNAYEARKICLNTISNNYYRWLKSGKKEDYLVFLSRKYAPIGVANDPKNLNVNWLENVKFYLRKQRGE